MPTKLSTSNISYGDNVNNHSYLNNIKNPYTLKNISILRDDDQRKNNGQLFFNGEYSS